jgi:iron complex outermembrane receptor protein
VDSTQTVSMLNAPPTYGVLSVQCENYPYESISSSNCFTHYFVKSHAPTWLADIDYTPTRDLLIYGKYSRGYRAAVVVPNIPFGGTSANPDRTLNYVKPEKVDAFEIGLKSSFAQAVHGTFNVAGFYNNFTNQQLQLGFLPKSSAYPETAAPVNAGKSKIYGVEVEASLRPFHGLDLDFGYTYLRTRIDAVLVLPSNAAYNTQASFNVGDPEVLSPRNKFTVGANYALPTPSTWGRLSVGGSVTYRSSMLTTYIDRSNPDPTIAAAGTLPSLTLVDGNVNWLGVGGSPIDLSFFITNIFDKHYYNFTAGLGSPQLGFDVQSVGAPRMFGGTAKVHF